MGAGLLLNTPAAADRFVPRVGSHDPAGALLGQFGPDGRGELRIVRHDRRGEAAHDGAVARECWSSPTTLILAKSGNETE
jgi:hypothetical protein